MDALAAGHDAAVQMIDTSVVRVHQGACVANNGIQAEAPQGQLHELQPWEWKKALAQSAA